MSVATERDAFAAATTRLGRLADRLDAAVADHRVVCNEFDAASCALEEALAAGDTATTELADLEAVALRVEHSADMLRDILREVEL